MLPKQVRQHIDADRCQRAQRLEIANAPTVADRFQSCDLRNLRIWNQHVAQFGGDAMGAADEFAAEHDAVLALNDLVVDDHAATVSGSDNDGDRRLAAICAE